jgi:hypothetical protein
MEEVRSVVARFPQRELEVRRRSSRDAHFRSICSDYEEATRALRYWELAMKEGQGGQTVQRFKEYVSLVAELEDEILTYLSCR